MVSQSVTLMAIVFGDLSGKENAVAASVVMAFHWLIWYYKTNEYRKITS